MTTLNRNPRPETPRGFNRKAKTFSSAQRLVESTWQDEAQALLAGQPSVSELEKATLKIEISSALRQPREWDIPAATAPKAAPRVGRQWEWWPVLAATLITIGAVWQLIWAIR